MTPAEYRTALTTLSLTPDQAAEWLGIGRSTAYRYLKTGCEGAVERALTLGVAIVAAERWAYFAGPLDRAHEIKPEKTDDGPWVRHSDLTAAVGLPG